MFTVTGVVEFAELCRCVDECVRVCLYPPPFLCWFGASPEGTQAELGPVPAFGSEFRPAIEVLRVV